MSSPPRFLFAAIACAGLSVSAPAAAQDCLTALTRWTRISDDALPPVFLTRDGTLPVQRVLVCEDRVHLFFRAREAHGVVDFCLVLFAPQPEEVARFYDRYGEVAADPVARVRDMAEHGARARDEFLAFKEALREVLGKRYIEGRTVSLARERYRPHLELGGGQIGFTWRHRSASFASWFLDVYYGPGASVSPLLLFILLYPR
ncbi:MAG: hypothetical protein OEO21_03570 [Candidatus Krumholzibacteria bacterium]|nr:hypothetical protein [Candidatus Krumholzibacteria bacterium]